MRLVVGSRGQVTSKFAESLNLRPFKIPKRLQYTKDYCSLTDYVTPDQIGLPMLLAETWTFKRDLNLSQVPLRRVTAVERPTAVNTSRRTGPINLTVRNRTL